jgi:hypothetical protein
MTPEIQRLIRHGLAPLGIIAVQQGWLPEAMQSSVLEFATIGVSILLPYAWSMLRDWLK